MEDNLYRFLRYYDASPQWLRGLAGVVYRAIPPSVRYGKIYVECIKLIQESQWWSRGEREDWQWRKLEALLKHAYHNVPYYRRVFDERGIRLRNIQNLDDFRQIPFLTKQSIRDNLKDLIARNYPKSKWLHVTTGGSTGDPVALLYEKGYSRAREFAFTIALWGRIGYELGDRMVVLKDCLVPSAKKGKFWLYEPIKNRLLFSIYHMSDANIPAYIQRIRDFRPKFIHAFPSALMILARSMRLKSVSHFAGVEAVFCGSENLYPSQRRLFEEIFKCRVLDCYGQVELVTLAGGCERSNQYHIFPTCGITEVIGEDGNPIAHEDRVGEIVGTGFNNWLMPLIRYKTGDLAVPGNSDCGCGRAYPLLRGIQGRTQDFFVTKDNCLVPLIGNYDIAAKMLGKIRELQFVQEEKGLVTVNMIVESGCSARQAETELLSKLRERSGDYLDFQVKSVCGIARTKRGKLKLLIQKVPIECGRDHAGALA